MAIFRLLNFTQWRLLPKMLLVLLASSLIPLALVAYVASSMAYDALLESGKTALVARGSSTVKAIDEYLTVKVEDIVVMSRLPEIRAFAANPRDATLRANALQTLQAMTQKKDYVSVAIANTAGIIILSSSAADINTDIHQLEHFYEGLRGPIHISDPFVTVTDELTIFLSTPLLDAGGKPIGVLLSRIAMYGLWELVESDKDIAGPGTVGLLLDENGIRLASSLSKDNRAAMADRLLYRSVTMLSSDVAQRIILEQRFGPRTSERMDVISLPEVAAALRRPEIKTFETTADDSTERHFAAIASMTRKPWRYVLMTPLTTLTGPANQIRNAALFISIIIAIFTVIFAYLLAVNLAAPIIKLTQIADRISLGELDVPIDIRRGDEVGDLAEAIRRMQISLKAAVERLLARRTTG